MNSKNDMVQARTKHGNIRFYFSRQAVKSGELKLIYCPTEVMLPDALSITLCEIKFARFSKPILFQDQSESAEDQESAAGLVLKQAHAT